MVRLGDMVWVHVPSGNVVHGSDLPIAEGIADFDNDELRTTKKTCKSKVLKLWGRCQPETKQM